MTQVYHRASRGAIPRHQPVGKRAELSAAPPPGSLPLTDWEIARRDRLRSAEDRAAYEAAHLLARHCAAELLGAEPAALVLRQRCTECGGNDHGRPSIFAATRRALGEPVHISLSHTRGYVAAIAARTPCGIDIEHHSRSVVRRALSPRESEWLDCQVDAGLAFARLWTLKESLIKTGIGSIEAPQLIDTRALDPSVLTGECGDGNAVGSWSVQRSGSAERHPAGQPSSARSVSPSRAAPSQPITTV